MEAAGLKGDIEMRVSHEVIVAAVQMYLNTQFAEGKSLLVLSITKEQYGEIFVIKASGAVAT